MSGPKREFSKVDPPTAWKGSSGQTLNFVYFEFCFYSHTVGIRMLNNETVLIYVSFMASDQIMENNSNWKESISDSARVNIQNKINLEHFKRLKDASVLKTAASSVHPW